MKDSLDNEKLRPYVNVVDYFLFDTKGKERGGNGIKFDWSVLKDYHLKKPFLIAQGVY